MPINDQTTFEISTSGRVPDGTIDPASVRLAGAAPVKHLLTDLNGDGYPDLKLFFNAEELIIHPDDPHVQMMAQDHSGRYMVGFPLVRLVPGK